MYRFLRTIILSLILVICCAGLFSVKHWKSSEHSFQIHGGHSPSRFFHIQGLSCQGDVYFVLAAAGCSSIGSKQGPTSQGQMATVDGREINWSCSSTLVTNGTATIDGQQFDLKNGAVFVVSATENATKVEQLNVELSKAHGAR